MKTANVYDIERALQQPITPQQRQTAAANNPLAAVIAERLNGLEGTLRQKLQTPPPPQGTVMNQYFQWPQQTAQYGLAQPGLEELAQQYAAGGLVAFAEGGPTQYGDENNGLFDTDGANGYAAGGLAAALPMGYAGYDDVPVFNGYSKGGSPLREVFPYTDFDEKEYEAGEGENFGDVGTGTYGITKEDLAADKRATDIAQEREDAKRRVEERKAMERYSAGPGDILGKGVEGAKKLGSTIADMAFIKDPAWESRQAEKKQQAEDYYKTTSPPPSRNKPAEQGIATVPTEPGFMDRAKDAVSSIGKTIRDNTVSGEDVKREQQIKERSRAVAAKNAQAEQPTKKAAYSPPAAQGTTVMTNGVVPQVGTSGLEPIPAEEQRRREMDAAREAGLREMNQPAPVTQTPERQAVSRVVNSNLTADQQIAALEKYFQTDTSEAMRIKGEMEKENARAGNIGILSALAGAVGAGLGTYGPGSRRWGAGLMQMASGVMGEQQQAESRQAKLNDLALKVKEMQGSGTRKAAEMVLSARAKADAEKSDLQKMLLQKKLEGEYGLQKAEIGAGATRYAADQRADSYANKQQGSGGMNEYQRKQIEAKAVELGMKDYEDLIRGKQPDENLKQQLINKYYQQLIGGTPMGASAPQGPATYRIGDGGAFSVNQ